MCRTRSLDSAPITNGLLATVAFTAYQNRKSDLSALLLKLLLHVAAQVKDLVVAPRPGAFSKRYLTLI